MSTVKPRHRRAAIVLGVLVAVGAIVALVLNAFNSNLVFFYTPTQIAAKEAPQGRTFRVGGMVEKGSVTVDGVSLTVASREPDGFTIALIPHTMEATTLSADSVGRRVNLEADVVAKYVEALVRPHIPGGETS